MAKMSLLTGATTLVLLLVTFSATQTAADFYRKAAVLDSNGNPLEVGSEYYIRPAGIGFQGGIDRSTKNGILGCPLYAIQAASEADKGNAVTFTPADATQTQILVSSDIKIDSGFSAYCRNFGFWRVALDAMNRRHVVMASGDFDAEHGLFKIKRAKTKTAVGPTYKITYCPSTTVGPCGDLTTFKDFVFDVKLLGIANNPEKALEVSFVKKTAAAEQYSEVYTE